MDILYSRGTSSLVSEAGICSIAMPVSLRERMTEFMDTRAYPEAVLLSKNVIESHKFLHTASRDLAGCFGLNKTSVTKAVSNLCEMSSISLYDYDELNRLFSQLKVTTQGRLGGRPTERVRNIWSSWEQHPVQLEAEMLGWEGLVTHQDAVCVDQRSNLVEGTMEALFRFRNAMFLIATCGTGDIVLLPVADNVTNCELAQAWLRGDTVSGFPLPSFFSKGRT